MRMKVRNLINALKQYDPEMPLVVRYDHNEIFNLTHLEVIEITNQGEWWDPDVHDDGEAIEALELKSDSDNYYF